jgi:hypothetical protein
MQSEAEYHILHILRRQTEVLEELVCVLRRISKELLPPELQSSGAKVETLKSRL